jgi:hypothetical protein
MQGIGPQRYAEDTQRFTEEFPVVRARRARLWNRYTEFLCVSSVYPLRTSALNPQRDVRELPASTNYLGPGTKVMRLRGGGAPRTTLTCDQSPVWMAWRRTSRYWVSMMESCGVLP